jgi:UDP-N-acetylglucosamine--N-acetylmuramyl-(pentapeptide) pyrophosphoryl-undecaprenol N-acetylglucosamine transferase
MSVVEGRVVLVAGGTGGHVFPARAVAVELLARGHTLAFVTDNRGEGYGASIVRLDTYRLKAGNVARGNLLGRIKALLDIASGWWEARAILREIRPSVVVGFGGYPALPTMVAALQAKVPTVIHEQNAVLGRVNRSLAPYVDAIALSFPDTERLENRFAHKTVVTGNPVRPDIVPLRAAAFPAPAADGPLHLFVMGGSQGATALSTVTPQGLALLPADIRTRLRVSAQCRREDIDAARAAYAAAGIEARCSTFFDDVTAELGRTHVAITRAGASTVSELAAIGRPSILVPYPHATDDHQSANARALAAAGGAIVLAQNDFTPAALASRLADWLSSPAILTATAARARAVGTPDAASRLADLIDRVAPKSGARKSDARLAADAREARA